MTRRRSSFWRDSAPAARYQAVAHEIGHHAHKINPELVRAVVTRPDLLAELMPLYSWGYEGRHVKPLTTPQSMRYKPMRYLRNWSASFTGSR